MADTEAALEAARAARATGDLGGAFRLLTEALDAAELAQAPPAALAPIQVLLGQVAADFGDSAEARDWLTRAESAVEPEGPEAAAIHLALGRLDASAGLGSEARRGLRLALRGFDAAKDTANAARCHLELADLYVESGDATVAALELRAAQPLLTSADAGERLDARIVTARVSAARGATDEARAALDEAATIAHADVPERGDELDAIRSAWDLDPTAVPKRRRPAIDVAVSRTGFVSIVIGADGMIGEAAVVDTSLLDPTHADAVRRFVLDIGRGRRGFPVADAPRVEIGLFPDETVYGLAFAFYDIASEPVGFSILATGATDDGARLAKSDAVVSFYAGRSMTESYVGFSRHRAFRPGALTAVKERPVAFFVAYPDVRPDIAERVHDQHLLVASAFISIVQEDGDAAARLRRLYPS